jgi:mRNA interferase RelE/StbE
MPFSVTLMPRAMKALEKINEPYYSNLKSAIFSLAENPRPNGYRKLKGRPGYRLRVADYRIIYDIIDNDLIVNVINIGHRKDIYE